MSNKPGSVKEENNLNGEELTTQQANFIAALISGKNTKQAARSAGVTERTAYRWLSLPELKSELTMAQAAILGDATRRMERLLDSSLEVLEGLLKSENELVRARGVEMVFKHYVAMKSANELEARLSEIERQAASVNQQS